MKISPWDKGYEVGEFSNLEYVSDLCKFLHSSTLLNSIKPILAPSNHTQNFIAPIKVLNLNFENNTIRATE